MMLGCLLAIENLTSLMSCSHMSYSCKVFFKIIFSEKKPPLFLSMIKLTFENLPLPIFLIVLKLGTITLCVYGVSKVFLKFTDC